MSWPFQILTDEDKNHKTRKQVCPFSLLAQPVLWPLLI